MIISVPFKEAGAAGKAPPHVVRLLPRHHWYRHQYRRPNCQSTSRGWEGLSSPYRIEKCSRPGRDDNGAHETQMIDSRLFAIFPLKANVPFRLWEIAVHLAEPVR